MMNLTAGLVILTSFAAAIMAWLALGQSRRNGRVLRRIETQMGESGKIAEIYEHAIGITKKIDRALGEK